MKRFIFTHKELPEDFPYNDYEIIRNDLSDELDHHIWGELAGYKILYNRIINEKDENGMLLWDDMEYISLNHYRRIFNRNAVDNIYIPTPYKVATSVYNAYGIYHYIGDLELCRQAINEEFPIIANNLEKYLNGNIFIPYNMSIMQVFQFKDYMKFLFKILYNLHKKIGTNTYEERLDYIRNNADKYTGEAKNNKIEYQARIEGFCAERLSTIYWLYLSTFLNINTTNILLLEPLQYI